MKRILSLFLAMALLSPPLACPAAAASSPWIQIDGGGTSVQTVSLQGLPGQYTGVQITLELDRAPDRTAFAYSGAEAQAYPTFHLEGNDLTLYVTSKHSLNQGNSFSLGTLTADKSFQVVSVSGLKLVNVGSNDVETVVYDKVSMSVTPGASSPGTNNPGTSNPDTNNPGTNNPGSSSPGTNNPGTNNPGTNNPGTNNPGSSNPGTNNPGSSNPGTNNPGNSNPGTNNPGSGNSGSSSPGSDTPAPDQTITLPFTDVKKNDWFWESVAYVYNAGLMSGTGSTTFSPDLVTTRGMVVAILYRYEGSPAAGPSSFQDVPPEQYYASAVSWAAANEVVSGYGNGMFGPDQAITREQMAAILYRYARYKGVDVSGKADLSVYSDVGQVSTYALEAMAWANQSGLIAGVDSHTLQPGGPATRGQVAAILTRFCKNIADK